MTDSVIRAPSVRVSAYSSQYILSSFGPAAYHADALPERAVCSAAGHRSRPDVRRLASRIRTGTLTATSPLHDTVRTVCTCPISSLQGAPCMLTYSMHAVCTVTVLLRMHVWSCVPLYSYTCATSFCFWSRPTRLHLSARVSNRVFSPPGTCPAIWLPPPASFARTSTVTTTTAGRHRPLSR